MFFAFLMALFHRTAGILNLNTPFGENPCMVKYDWRNMDRKQTFSFAFLKQTFLSVPVRGNILQGLPPVYTERSRHA
jgi:hypothetical protein